MPITYWTSVVGGLALCGIPPFAGFFSKDAIIEAAELSRLPGHGYAAFAVTASVFVTALYTFRLLFMSFHGEERFRHAAGHDEHAEHGAADSHADPQESPWVVTVPLVLLAIPSVYSGWAYIDRVLFGGFFGGSIVISPQHPGLATMAEEWHGPWEFVVHSVASLPLWLALAGIAAAWYLYILRPELPAALRERGGAVYRFFANNYYIDRFNDWFFAGGFRRIGTLFSDIGDRSVIDGFFVNGSAKVVQMASSLLRHIQSGYIYHYAFTMIIGVLALLTWYAARP